MKLMKIYNVWIWNPNEADSKSSWNIYLLQFYCTQWWFRVVFNTYRGQKTYESRNRTYQYDWRRHEANKIILDSKLDELGRKRLFHYWKQPKIGKVHWGWVLELHGRRMSVEILLVHVSEQMRIQSRIDETSLFQPRNILQICLVGDWVH